jgi:hypothetical protein
MRLKSRSWVSQVSSPQVSLTPGMWTVRRYKYERAVVRVEVTLPDPTERWAIAAASGVARELADSSSSGAEVDSLAAEEDAASTSPITLTAWESRGSVGAELLRLTSKSGAGTTIDVTQEDISARVTLPLPMPILNHRSCDTVAVYSSRGAARSRRASTASLPVRSYRARMVITSRRVTSAAEPSGGLMGP